MHKRHNENALLGRLVPAGPWARQTERAGLLFAGADKDAKPERPGTGTSGGADSEGADRAPEKPQAPNAPARPEKPERRAEDEGFFGLGGSFLDGGPAGGPGKGGPFRVNWAYLLVLVALAVYLGFNFGQGGTAASSPTELPTSEFVTAVEEDRVATARYTVLNGEVSGQYWKKKPTAAKRTSSPTTPPPTWARTRWPSSWPTTPTPPPTRWTPPTPTSWPTCS